MSRKSRLFPWLFLTALAVFLLNQALEAQYFGRNKVQYKTFDFQVLRTEHFDIYFYPQERQAVQQASLMAERWYARLSRVLGHQLTDRQPLILAQRQRQVNPIGHTLLLQRPVTFRMESFFAQRHIQPPGRGLVFKQVIDFLGRLKTVAAGN